MAAPTGALVYKDTVLTVDGDAFANQHTKARLVPDTPIQTIRTAVPDGAVQDVDSTTWVFELSGIQDNGTGGLAKALRDAAGTTIEIVLQPKAGFSQPKATFDVVVTNVEFGGEQGAFMTFDVEFPVIGEPDFGTSPAS